MGGDLTLLDGDVYYFVFAVDVSDGVYMRLAGPHRAIDSDASVIGFNSGVVQAQPIDIRTAAQRLKDQLAA